MAAIDDLIAQIENPALRNRLSEEFTRLTRRKKFGLVFEEHLPELTPVRDATIRPGAKVSFRGKPIEKLWRVLSVGSAKALCQPVRGGTQKHFNLDTLVVVYEFGEPIFPALETVDRITNGPKDSPWHTLIEADNYHALQLLHYCYAGQVDCIYIDPPYNTGARDWKYNNDYVDQNDRWRHSKWLAMMKRRMLLAKRLLTRDGVLICAIDDNELATLLLLLEEIFPESEIFPVTVKHNRSGTQGTRFSVKHEYALFVLKPNSQIFRRQLREADTYNLRRWGSTSERHEGANCFYPIYCKDGKVIGFGDVLPEDQSPNAQVTKNHGVLSVWPIDIHGVERKWRYARQTVEDIWDRLIVAPSENRIEIKVRKADEPFDTVWTDRRYNAEEYGTKLNKRIVGSHFDYPKSLYTVQDCLHAAVSGKSNAIVLDFFAGSGTTLHAVNLLNAIDKGTRQCILVTNNELKDSDAKAFYNQGLRPGDSKWESHGVCQSVTWPRSKYTILGRRDDGSQLDGDYLTGSQSETQKPRQFKHIDFLSSDSLNSKPKKKRLIAILNDIPQNAIVADNQSFVVPDGKSASILFDDSAVDDWLEALQGQTHITHFYIVTAKPKHFRDIRRRVNDLLGPYTVLEELKRPLSKGFAANLEYFRLNFLDKDQVALGRRFTEILPLLWLRAGAVGPRPQLKPDELEPAMLIPKPNKFAVLLDETQFKLFQDRLKTRNNITHVFLVTDSPEGFAEMANMVNAICPDAQLIQLYRDYLENFLINREGSHAEPKRNSNVQLEIET